MIVITPHDVIAIRESHFAWLLTERRRARQSDPALHTLDGRDIFMFTSINGLLHFAILDWFSDPYHHSRADAQHEHASRSHFDRRSVSDVPRLQDWERVFGHWYLRLCCALLVRNDIHLAKQR
jgi:hypothetical protein